MADGQLNPSTRRAARRVNAPSWSRVALLIALVYTGARIVTTGFLLIAAAAAGPDARFGPGASLADYVLGWDAQWYWFIAVNGYPAELPLTETGAVGENAWAFMPIYALLSAAVGGLIGSWGAGAFVVSLVAGYLSCLALFALLRERIEHGAALWAVILFACSPLAALFQIGYAESLFLLWVLLALLALSRRRYVLLYPLILLMGFTRPGVLAFALLIGLVGIARLFRHRTDPVRRRDVVHILATGALATTVGFSWQVIAAVVTGRADAYLATELAWRRSWTGEEDGFVPFAGWFQGAELWGGLWGVGSSTSVVVAVVVLLLVAGVLLFEPHVRRLGPVIRLWAASYLLYLVAVFFPQSSVFRLLFPLSPLWGALAQPRSRLWRGGVLLVSLLGQWWWIWNMYGQGTFFWQVP